MNEDKRTTEENTQDPVSDQGTGEQEQAAPQSGTGETPDPTTSPEWSKEGVVTGSVPEAQTAPEKKGMFTIGVVLVILILAALGWYFFSSGGAGSTLIPGSDNASNDTGANVVGSRNYPEVVAVVNGEEVGRQEFAEAVSNYGQQAQSQGVDLSSEENQAMVEQEALTTLINTTLIMQEAQAAGIEVSEEAIEAELQGLRDQLGGQENFDARLEAMGLTEAEVRADVADQLLVNEYIESLSGMDEIEVTEEEVQQFYDELSAGGQQELPPLEELAPRIEAQLESQERQAVIQEVIATLRAEAEIEQNI